nr:S-antigen protein [Ipomoea batatas]
MMMMRQDFSAGGGGGGGAASDPNCCRNCGVKERPLHEVCHRGNFRKVCTSCVLRLHPQSFCPTCFTVYNPSQPHSSMNDVVTCFKCYSASHSQCVGPRPPTPYVCPICVSPNSPLFAPKRTKDANADAKFENDDNSFRVVDKKAARVFLAAARIAVMSTSKAALAAKAEAEKRAKEAANTRKRAREALEHLSNLVAMEKMRRKEFLLPPPDVSQPGGLVHMSDNKGWNMGTAKIPAAVQVQHDDRNRFRNLNRVETSSEVLAALNAVGLRERERMQEVEVQNPAKNVNMMDVEENGGSTMASDLVNSGSVVQSHGGGIQIDKSGNVGNVDNIENCNGRGMRINNGTVPIPSVEDRNQQIQRIQAGEQINSSLKQ